MKILGDVLKLATQYLKEQKDTHPRRHAEILLSYILKLPRLHLYLEFERPLEEEELSSFRKLLKRKASGEPVEYICGEISFYGCQIKVTPDVLIPRPETELLLDQVCAAVQKREGTRKWAWDLCCGSGCLGIALKKHLPSLTVTLADISEKALSLAKENSARNGVEVELLCGDLLAPFHGRKADVILCNPPYVSKKEFNTLAPSVKDFEPSLALQGGETGLLYYERLSQELPQYLAPHAQVFLEVGASQAPAVLDLFRATHWVSKEIKKDWAGHDRFFFLEFE